MHQAARLRGHGGLAQLQGVHLAQALEPLHGRLRLLALGGDAVQHAFLLRLVQRVVHLLADVDAVQRRHGHMDVPGVHHRLEVHQEQRAQERGDVGAVGVRIGQNADLTVAQSVQVLRAGIHADGHGDVVDFLRTEHLRRIHLPSVEDLPAQRQQRLEFAVAGALGGAAGRVALHQEQLAALALAGGAIHQLAGQRRAAGDFLAHHLLRRLGAPLRVADGELGDAVAFGGVLVQPQAERVLGDAGHEYAALPRRQALLGLAGELPFDHLHREHVGALRPDVLAGDLHAARQQIAKLAVFAQRLHQAAAQPGDVRAALRRGDEVHVALGYRFAAVRAPLQRPFHRLGVAFRLVVERRRGEGVAIVQGAGEIAGEAGLEAPSFAFGFFAGLLHREGDGEPGAQHRLGAQQVAQLRQRDAGGVEVRGVRQEADGGAGVAPAHAVHDFQRGGGFALAEALLVDLAVALHFHRQPLGKGVHHGHAHAVQAAGEAVVLVVELAAGVQLGEDEFDAGEAVLRVDVHRHAAAVVAHVDGAVRADDNFDVAGETGQRLVHAVVHHLLHQVVGMGGVRVHARPAAHRRETGEHLDGFGGVVFHGRSRSLRSIRRS